MVEASPLASTGRMSLPQPGSMPETNRDPPPSAMAVVTGSRSSAGADVGSYSAYSDGVTTAAPNRMALTMSAKASSGRTSPDAA
jgi:hypothetical protein